jgi:hypothetical protein
MITRGIGIVSTREWRGGKEASTRLLLTPTKDSKHDERGYVDRDLQCVEFMLTQTVTQGKQVECAKRMLRNKFNLPQDQTDGHLYLDKSRTARM